MNQENLKAIIETWKTLSDKDEAIKKLFQTADYYLGDEIYKLQEFILSYIGFPEDTTVQLKLGDDGWFSRDWLHDEFYKCQNGKIRVSGLMEWLIREYNDDTK